MATARVTQRFADGGEVEVCVEVDANYPDAVAQAVAEALRLWHLAVPDDAADE